MSGGGGSTAAEVEQDGRPAELQMGKQKEAEVKLQPRSEARVLRAAQEAEFKMRLEMRVQAADADLRRRVASENLSQRAKLIAQERLRRAQACLLHAFKEMKHEAGGGRSDADAAAAEVEEDGRAAEFKMEKQKEVEVKLQPRSEARVLSAAEAVEFGVEAQKLLHEGEAGEPEQRAQKAAAELLHAIVEAEKDNKLEQRVQEEEVLTMEKQQQQEKDIRGAKRRLQYAKGRLRSAIASSVELVEALTSIAAVELEAEEYSQAAEEHSQAAGLTMMEQEEELKKLKQRVRVAEAELKLRRALASETKLEAEKDSQTSELKMKGLKKVKKLKQRVRKASAELLHAVEEAEKDSWVLELMMEAQQLLQKDKAWELERRIKKKDEELRHGVSSAASVVVCERNVPSRSRPKRMVPQGLAGDEGPRKAIEDLMRDPNRPFLNYHCLLFKALEKGNASLLPPDAQESERARAEALDRIYEYDPKVGYPVFTRITCVDSSTFDLDEESPFGPMRDTDAPIRLLEGNVCKEDKPGERSFRPCYSANIFSVKIVSSDVGFPINVYGTVIARDSLDLKCVYLFKRGRHECQLILSKDESLVLTGPKRGLALDYTIFFEVDLKIKGGRKQKDVQLSKGVVELDGVPRTFKDENRIERYYLESMMSKVVLTCAVEKRAIEATISIEIIQGEFYGEITASTTSVADSIVLHDSKMAPDWTGKGICLLMRHVVAVNVNEKLILSAARFGSCKSKSNIRFSPKASGRDEKLLDCGFVKMRVHVSWSIISRLHLHGC